MFVGGRRWVRNTGGRTGAGWSRFWSKVVPDWEISVKQTGQNLYDEGKYEEYLVTCERRGDKRNIGGGFHLSILSSVWYSEGTERRAMVFQQTYDDTESDGRGGESETSHAKYSPFLDLST
jgi:hypothetical protein